MPELLLELFSEEIPARMQKRASGDLARMTIAALKGVDLEHSGVLTHVTPRRLTLVVADLPAVQPDLCEEKRGPRVDAPEKAIEGFLKANGLTRDQCEERTLDKGTFLFAVIEKRGQKTDIVLAELLSGIIADFPWQKSMRWGDGEMKWVRSLGRILCLFDGNTIEIKTRNLVLCGNETSGHRFLAPSSFAVSDFADYSAKLRRANVILDREERKEIIISAARRAAEDEGLKLREDPGLLDEVAGLVEWPLVLIGQIDEVFLDVPDEVLVTSMRQHQKYFSLLNVDGTMAPRFILVANNEAKDGGNAIVAGNERVLRARLSDARFFWEQDRKVLLETRLRALTDNIFHTKLGTMGQKVARIEFIATNLAQFIPQCDPDPAKRAAQLAKADLMTEMVCEFPELQGTMGRNYALFEGESEEVALAIGEHYSPVGPNDVCPTSPVSVAVALADKLDTLVGFFVIDEKPTGSRDPYALRRATLGIIRLILENQLRLSLREAFREVCRGYKKTVSNLQTVLDDRGEAEVLERELLDFFLDRLKVYLREQGVRNDHVEAVFLLGDEDDLVRLLVRVNALSDFLATDDGANLLAAYKRAANLVNIEEKKDGISYDGEVIASQLKQEEEILLCTQLTSSAKIAYTAINDERYVDAMKSMSTLRVPVDLFFTHVNVNSDDPKIRENRLRLLSQFRSILSGIADFSRLES